LNVLNDAYVAGSLAPRDHTTKFVGVDEFGRLYRSPFALTPICAALRCLV
jgi:hypothetical protein